MKAQTILVTGATSGIGFAVCSAARATDLHVIGVQKNKAGGKRLQALVAQDSLSSIVTADLSRESDIENLCTEIKAKDISLPWIIHAAGMIDEHERDSVLSSERVQECFQVNTFAAMRISQALEPLIAPLGGEIFIGSTAGIWGNSGFPVYAATKAALHNFALSLSRKWSGTARKSIVVAPGATNTRMREKTVGDAATSQSPEFVAQIVLDIMTGAYEAMNGDIVLVKNGAASTLAPVPMN